MTIKDYTWTVPFLSFLAGYQLISLLVSIETIKTPPLVGKPLPVALRLLSEHNINARLLAEKPDADLPEATVLAQTPEEGTKIKPRQNVFLVVSKRPPAITAPSLVGLDVAACVQKAQEKKVRLKTFQVMSRLPAGQCFAQYPAPGQELENKTMIIYVSRPESQLVILPDLTEKALAEACRFLESHEFETEIFHAHRSENSEFNENALIIEQKPRAGSLVDMQKQQTVKLYI